MSLLLTLLPLLFLGTGCSPMPADPGAPTAAPSGERKNTFALVVKSLENPYMSTMYDGFRSACDELGAEALLLGPGANGNPNQAQVILNLIDQGVDAVAIAANDMEELSPALRRAKEAGISVVSLDSVVKPSERIVHIQQASPEIIGRVLIQACADDRRGRGIRHPYHHGFDAKPGQLGGMDASGAGGPPGAIRGYAAG